ncbi:hypothetical protein [Mesorhizobium australafricanum]|uniref:Four helix bundle protein n=1 Tax=Mesorhizobium australafricanum TaxID=3072311 RepID=A0ABU4WYC1_9HYPH|nr:hypothetical protein [Mesorhizobium sp. VK3E]MDX8439794.1 hypothetical protein [Mesorhizobium sp. VK3E]
MTGKINSYKDLIVWQQAMDLAVATLATSDEVHHMLSATAAIGKMLRQLTIKLAPE